MTSLRARLVLFALLVTACGRVGPDPVCISSCEVRNDQCMVQARHPEAIQRCDATLGACVAGCR